MSIPKEPRQIMINLMYLVLTALLALNVSNEILNAFKVLAKGIDDSNHSIDKKTAEVYNQIKANELQPGQSEKVKPYRMKADEVVKQSDVMIKFFDEWKKRIIAESGGYNDDSTIKAEGNIDATTSLLVEKNGGDTIKSNIAKLRKFMLEQLSVKDSMAVSPLMALRVEEPPKSEHNPTRNWNIGYFEHMPTVAAIAMFSKFQNDIRSSEALVMSKLFDEAHLSDIKFDTITAIAVPTTSYALEGQKIEAQILLAAFNKSNKPIVAITGGGGTKKDAKNGVVPWETIATGTGLQTVKGTIKLETGDAPIVRNWEFKYMVGSTGASMQLDKMNVFYIGVDNPVTVAAAGYSVEDVSLDIPGATITGDKGHFTIRVDKPVPAEVAIMAKTQDGTKKKVGGMTVRVKRIPNPVAKVDKITGGPYSAAKLRVQIAPYAELEFFEFDAHFIITSFTYSTMPKGGEYQGPFTVKAAKGCRFQGDGENANIAKLVRAAKAGDRVFIEDIKAVGPDGTTRTLNSIILALN